MTSASIQHFVRWLFFRPIPVLVACQLSIEASNLETLIIMRVSQHWRWAHGQLEAWKFFGWRRVHMCGVVWDIFWKRASTRTCLKRILFCSARLRHFPPAVQLCLLHQLVHELAKQLGGWQIPFLAATPPSESQLLRFSWGRSKSSSLDSPFQKYFEIQGAQCYREKSGTQELDVEVWVRATTPNIPSAHLNL